MRVRAIQLGYYNLIRRKPGTVFHIREEKEFSKKWMHSLDKPELNDESTFDPSSPVNESMSVGELHDYCKDHGLTGYRQMKKADLIAAINMDLLDKEEPVIEEDVI